MSTFSPLLLVLCLASPCMAQQKTEDPDFRTGSRIAGVELTPVASANLTRLGKVWGFLKYYHPVVVAGQKNWDYELFKVMPGVIAAESTEAGDLVLNRWIATLGEFETIDYSKPAGIKIAPDHRWMEEQPMNPELRAALRKVESAKRPGTQHYAELVRGVGNPKFLNENDYGTLVFPDTGYRLLSLYRYWNMIQYFFPYRELIDGGWSNVLSEFVPEMVKASNETEYKTTLLRIITRVNDTHANIWGEDQALSKFKGERHSAVEINWVEDKPVVIDYIDKLKGPASGLLPGDVLESVDGKSVEQIVMERSTYTPASNKPRMLYGIGLDLLRTNNHSVEVTYIRNGKREATSVPTYSTTEINVWGKQLEQATGEYFKMIDSDVAYIFPGAKKNIDLAEIMSKAAKTRGLVVDLRCYPSEFIVFTLGEHLMPQPTSFVKFTAVSLMQPGYFLFGTELKVGRENPGYYKGKVVILVNETTLSQAEYTTMAFRVAPKAIVMGSSTAAADGNVSAIVLPGGVKTMITGIGVYYPDGTETQRVGIVPDIVVKPTIIGIKEGRDEVLEAALKLIRKKS
jgi:C-terminal processing protease CtpA/Prc